MVRLLQRHLEFLAQVIRGFNPTMVRLLPILYRGDVEVSEGFNPTMVRLLPTCKSLGGAPKNMFQSHNGAIAALER